jgi:hypothetical protein
MKTPVTLYPNCTLSLGCAYGSPDFPALSVGDIVRACPALAPFDPDPDPDCSAVSTSGSRFFGVSAAGSRAARPKRAGGLAGALGELLPRAPCAFGAYFHGPRRGVGVRVGEVWAHGEGVAGACVVSVFDFDLRAMGRKFRGSRVAGVLTPSSSPLCHPHTPY